jgi:hypothetical protein
MYGCRHKDPLAADQPCGKQVEPAVLKACIKAQADLLWLEKMMDKTSEKKVNPKAEDDKRLAACSAPLDESEDSGLLEAPSAAFKFPLSYEPSNGGITRSSEST